MARQRQQSQQRFSDRVEDYVRWRPTYPVDVVRTMESECGVHPDHTHVVDLGCGTGISAQLFLAEGYEIVGVEPNDEMRNAALRLLGNHSRFQVVDGAAEDTRLPDACADLVLAAQAFHWFDPAATREEIRRILTPAGVVALLWNERKVAASPFLRSYEAILVRYGTDYQQVDHRNVEEKTLAGFFGTADYKLKVFANHQDLDLNGLIGRARSSSYVPGPDHPDYPSLRAALKSAFAEHARDGIVRLEYDTKLYYGTLSLQSG